MNRNRLLKRIEKHEGYRQFVYLCPAGKLTLGIGRNVDEDGGKGISRAEAKVLLSNDVDVFADQLSLTYAWFNYLDDIRKEAMVEMAFQLGMGGFSKFRNMIMAMGDRHHVKAALEMIDSRWHEQTPARCEELAEMVRTGECDAG